MNEKEVIGHCKLFTDTRIPYTVIITRHVVHTHDFSFCFIQSLFYMLRSD